MSECKNFLVKLFMFSQTFHFTHCCSVPMMAKVFRPFQVYFGFLLSEARHREILSKEHPVIVNSLVSEA